MGRKRQQVAEAAPAAEPEGVKVKFAEAVRQSIQAVSDDGSRESTKAVRAHLKETFPEHAETAESPQFNSQLSQQRGKLGISTGRGEGGEAAPARSERSEGGAAGLSLDAARSVKQFMDNHSAEALEDAIHLFGRFGVSGVKTCAEFIALFRSK